MAAVTLTIHPQQVKCIADRNAAVQAMHVEVQTAEILERRAQQRLNDALSGIVAGHGYDVVSVVAFDAEANTLTIETPEPEPVAKDAAA